MTSQAIRDEGSGKAKVAAVLFVLAVVTGIMWMLTGCTTTDARPTAAGASLFGNVTIKQSVVAAATSHTTTSVDAKLHKVYSARDRKSLDDLIARRVQ